MKYRFLPGTSVLASTVGLGTWQLSGEWSKQYGQREVDEMIDMVRQVGINLIDTAECYGDHTAEQLVGRSIARDRARWIVATKFGHRFLRPFERERAYEPSAVLAQLEDSLRALRTDHIDIYQFHSAENSIFDNAPLWEMLRKQVDAGKIRYLGISVRHSDDLHQVDRATAVGAKVVQVTYNRLDRKPEAAFFGSCQRQCLAVLVREPLASGFLSGKYLPGDVFAEDDVREKWRREGRDDILEQVQLVKRTEVPEDVPMAAWAIAWCLRHPTVTSVVVGCKSVAQITENATAAELFGGLT